MVTDRLNLIAATLELCEAEASAGHKTLAAAYPAQAADLKKNNITFEGHVYPNAVHGFFNDATPERYNRVAAQQAWARTTEWFNQYARSA